MVENCSLENWIIIIIIVVIVVLVVAVLLIVLVVIIFVVKARLCPPELLAHLKATKTNIFPYTKVFSVIPKQNKNKNKMKNKTPN